MVAAAGRSHGTIITTGVTNWPGGFTTPPDVVFHARSILRMDWFLAIQRTEFARVSGMLIPDGQQR